MTSFPICVQVGKSLNFFSDCSVIFHDFLHIKSHVCLVNPYDFFPSFVSHENELSSSIVMSYLTIFLYFLPITNPLFLTKSNHYLFSLIKSRSHYVAQGGLELLSPSNPPASASQVDGITIMCHCA